MHTIGFLVNPVAGMGGVVGLKGTDGLVQEAIRRGAHPVSAIRAEKTLGRLKSTPFAFLTCSGKMGQAILERAGITNYRVVYEAPDITTGLDTNKACRALSDHGAEIVLFCGGDGTARDVYDSVGDVLPVLGIPSGVKMYSAVFATSPETAAEILQGWEISGSLHLRDAEVMDVDEEAYRKGELRAELYGYARSPFLPGLVQAAKQVFEDPDEEQAKRSIAQFLVEVMRGTPGILYIIGPGSTTRAIAAELGIEKTLLGFDAVREGKLVAADLNEEGMLQLLSERGPSRLVVSIIGALGAVLGRGTQQVSPRVLRTIGKDQVIVVSTPQKLASTPVLFIDTGDSELDQMFGENISVITGYRIAQRKRLASYQGVVEK
ncbi:MAG: ATP-NAD kinase family protein [Methanoregulaceae archaeon]|nr:ATP-NAD kinase family protein [Methanoregulaceae archaeon]